MERWTLLAVLLFLMSLMVVTSSALNVTTIIRANGYPCEDYTALTPDGYYLSLQRIPHGRHSTKPTKGVVFFQHGLVDNSVGITLNPSDEALPYILADSGYEVWLGNNRGNGYSMKHVKYTTDDPEFWQFSYDEMAAYDLPTQIDFVLQTTGAKKLAYIGHSEGTTQAFAGFLNATVASKVTVFIGLAPVAFVGNEKALLLRVLAGLDAAGILQLLGDHEFFLIKSVKKLLPGLCAIDPDICDYAIELLMGPSVNTNITRLPYYLRFEPNPTSVLNIIHWSQATETGNFQKLDWGTEGNLQHYGQPTPPQYDLSQFPSTLPVAFFTGGNDFLADPEDVLLLIAALGTPPVFIHDEPTFSHADFLWAEDSAKVIFPQIIDLLEKYHDEPRP